MRHDVVPTGELKPPFAFIAQTIRRSATRRREFGGWCARDSTPLWQNYKISPPLVK